MDFKVFFIIITSIYAILLFFDRFLKSCCHYPYLRLTEKSGIEIWYFSIIWKTKSLNRQFQKWAYMRPRFWKRWFTFGVYVSLISLPVFLILLCYNFYELIHYDRQIHGSNRSFIIQPLVPGLNLSLSDFGYYSIAIFICCIVHESGHALAAVLEDLNILEIGFTLFLTFPAAFVNIASEKLTMLNTKRKLSILCAGIWHNIVLSAFGYAIFLCLPVIFSLFYDIDRGISVSEVASDSALARTSRGLFPGDIITKLNSCKIKNSNDWYECLRSKELLLPGLCIQTELVFELDETVPVRNLDNGYVECCDSTNKKNLCFEYVNVDVNNELEFPEHVCLPGRTIIEKSTNYCVVVPDNCPKNSYCFRPVLTNSTFLFRILCKNKIVIYLGHPNDLWQTVKISSFIKKTALLTTAFPDIVTKFIKYIVTLSLGLAFINILPVFYMDGQYIYRAIIRYFFKERITRQHIKLFINITVWVFTIFVILYLILIVNVQLL